MSSLFDQSQILERAESLVAAATKAGADAADAIAARSASTSLTFREGKMEENEHSENDSIALRVFVDGCKASISTNATASKDELAKLAERAVEMAKLSPPDPYARLADPKELMATDEMQALKDKLDLVDDFLPDHAFLKTLAQETEEAALAVDGVSKSGGASAGHGIGGMVLATSHGFVGSYLSSQFSFSTTVIAGDGTAMERDYDYSACLHHQDLKTAASVGQKAGERAVARLNPAKVETGTYDIVYDPRIATSLIGHFIGAINGAAIARQTSFLKDKLGQQIFAKGITISDDPLRPRGMGSHPFDGEGVGSTKINWIEDGFLTQWVLDSATAAELGLQTNGRAARAGANPRPGSTNLTLEAGETSPQELICNIKDGIYLTDLIGQGVNGVTGDYSRGASGFRIRNGEIAEAVSEFTIAGNLHDMFARLIPASDLVLEKSTNAPTCLIEAMTVAGR
ncbi:MAG: TldD/PmbA family protein [Cohaesibacter sp.]|nr:TldD/PmbA family protein [Cohaesibacter sp.]MCV6600574.1 TldD/PmbA family protein [Cohaesibacter sp.]